MDIEFPSIRAAVAVSLLCCIELLLLRADAAQVDQEPAPAVSKALAHEAYVWQRTWTEPVRTAIREHSGDFKEIIVLSAEVAWRGGRPTVTRMAVDWDGLRQARCEVGLAVRIGSYRGPFSVKGEPTDSLVELATGVLHDAATRQVRVRELQIDFDCAESKLSGYELWVKALRAKVAPTPLVITTLPSWLQRPEFKRLVSSAEAYVLQVHSVDRPKSSGAGFTLCDPAAARRAVQRAGEMGVPFRVALPTYGYVVAFDEKGALLGLSAEGPARPWPVGAQVKELRADPTVMADLVREWTAAAPAALRGVIWYRLPTEADTLNWRWPTLAAVMQGREPQGRLHCESRSNGSGPVDVSLVNDGEMDAALPAEIVLRWGDGHLIAADALAGFERAEPVDARSLRFTSTRQGARLAPGERCVVGWLRLDRAQAIEVDLREKTK